MNGRFAIALALAALTSAAHAEIHTRTSFTITIGNHPVPAPRVVVVEPPPPHRVVYVERPAPRCHGPRVVYVEPRHHRGPERVVVIRDHARFDHGPYREERLAMDERPRSINR